MTRGEWAKPGVRLTDTAAVRKNLRNSDFPQEHCGGSDLSSDGSLRTPTPARTNYKFPLFRFLQIGRLGDFYLQMRKFQIGVGVLMFARRVCTAPRGVVAIFHPHPRTPMGPAKRTLIQFFRARPRARQRAE